MIILAGDFCFIKSDKEYWSFFLPMVTSNMHRLIIFPDKQVGVFS